MTWKDQYERWKNDDQLDELLREQLEKISDEENALEDAFYKSLEFGTGGMRGVIGPGTNRMNIYMVRKAAKGLAMFISEKGKVAKERGVVISYDNRHFSREFALQSAKVLGAAGIPVYVFEQLRPTPELSFAVRKLETIAGIMITASHNPPEYNGFKVYGEDGAQLVGEDSEQLLQNVNSIEDEFAIETLEEKELLASKLLTYVGQDMDEAYEEELMTVVQDKQLVSEKGSDLSIVFTPLHGASKIPVMASFKKAGFSNVSLVESQAIPDENFTNVTSANPEEHEAFDKAIEKGLAIEADILIATDPDGDRLGIAAKNEKGNYEVLTGNQTGALMLHYLLSRLEKQGRLPENGTMLQSIVSSPFSKEIARDFRVEAIDVLTGFKYIAERIRQHEENRSKQYLFGYEESYGYLIKPFVRDKDATQAALLAAETALYYKEKNMSLFEALHALYEKYGFYLETIRSFVFKGKQGVEQMKTLMDSFRKSGPSPIEGFQFAYVEDYLSGRLTNVLNNEKEKINLPSSNVLKYEMTDGSWFCLRPSGTEPKLKLYCGVKGESKEDATNKLESLITPLTKKVQEI